MRRFRRPEMSSTAGGHPRTCVGRFQARTRTRVFPRKDLALGAPSNATLRTSLSRHSKSPRPRPPSPLTGHTAMFARCADKRFSGSGYRPTISATALPTHGHTPEHPILAFFWSPAFAIGSRSALALAGPVEGPTTFPCRRRIASAASRISSSGTRRTALQARRKTNLEGHRSTGTPLAGDASIRPSLAAMAVGRQR